MSVYGGIILETPGLARTCMSECMHACTCYRIKGGMEAFLPSPDERINTFSHICSFLTLCSLHCTALHCTALHRTARTAPLTAQCCPTHPIWSCRLPTSSCGLSLSTGCGVVQRNGFARDGSMIQSVYVGLSISHTLCVLLQCRS
jgi:hypothetical protein